MRQRYLLKVHFEFHRVGLGHVRAVRVRSNAHHSRQYLFQLQVNNRDHSNRKSLDLQYRLEGVDLRLQAMRRAHRARVHNHRATTKATHLSRHQTRHHHHFCFRSREEFQLRSLRLHQNRVRALIQLAVNLSLKSTDEKNPKSQCLLQALDWLAWFVKKSRPQLLEASAHRHGSPKSQ